MGENERGQEFGEPLNDQGDASEKKWRRELECLRSAHSTWRPWEVTQVACALIMSRGHGRESGQRPRFQHPALRKGNHE